MVTNFPPHRLARCIISLLFCAFLIVSNRSAAQNSDTTFGWIVSAPPLPQGEVRANTLRAGREAVRLMRKRDGAALYARFSAREKKNATQTTWQQILNSDKLAKNDPPVGELVVGSLDAPIYYTVCPRQNGKWQEGIAVTFDSARANEIARLMTETQKKPAHQADTITFGRRICELIAKKDANALYPLFSLSPNMQPSSPAELRDSLTRSITPEKPMGRRIGDVVAPVSVDDEDFMYVAEFMQGAKETRKIILMFTPNHKKVTALFLVPEGKKPRRPQIRGRKNSRTAVVKPVLLCELWYNGRN